MAISATTKISGMAKIHWPKATNGREAVFRGLARLDPQSDAAYYYDYDAQCDHDIRIISSFIDDEDNDNAKKGETIQKKIDTIEDMKQACDVFLAQLKQSV
jgi:hypothetical protein